MQNTDRNFALSYLCKIRANFIRFEMIYLFINFIFWFSAKHKVHVPKGLFFIYEGGGGGWVGWLFSSGSL